MASAVNNVIARAAGLIAVAVLPLLAGISGTAALQPHRFATGFRIAVTIAGLTCAAGGIVALAVIRNPTGSSPVALLHLRRWHCALDGAPLQVAPTPPPGDAP